MTTNFSDWLHEDLKDIEEAKAFLQAALEENDIRFFLRCLKQVADAQGGLVELSRVTSIPRSSLYKALDEQGNPTLATLNTILQALGFRLSISPVADPEKPSAA